MDINQKLLEKFNRKGPRYTSYPPATHFSENYDDKDFINSVINSNNENPQNVSVYIHIPFCPQICHFCGCTTESGFTKPFLERYIDALVKEIEFVSKYIKDNRKLTQIHWGGGTPNAISLKYIQRVTDTIKKCFDLAYNHEGNTSFFCIGKKGADILSKNHNVIDSNNEIFDELSFEKVSLIAEVLMKKFTEKEVDSIQIVYNKFKNAATQIVMLEQYLPIENTVTENNQKESADYIFEPSKIEIISELIPKSLRTQLFKSIRDSYASEHGARMTAMHKATDNATELRDQLKLTYNKARQAAITNEILEIVGGAEALNS